MTLSVRRHTRVNVFKEQELRATRIKRSWEANWWLHEPRGPLSGEDRKEGLLNILLLLFHYVCIHDYIPHLKNKFLRLKYLRLPMRK